MAHSSLHYGGRGAATRTDDGEAPGGAAVRARPSIKQHLLPREGQCRQV